MKKLFALVVAAAMGMSSVAFAADTTAAPAADTVDKYDKAGKQRV